MWMSECECFCRFLEAGHHNRNRMLRGRARAAMFVDFKTSLRVDCCLVTFAVLLVTAGIRATPGIF